MTDPLQPRTLPELLQETPSDVEVWAVDLKRQKVHRHRGHGIWETASISSSRLGVGSEPDSHRTPVGWHRVSEIIGRGGPVDQEYISREPVSPSTREDRILSRILWLDGLEPGVNGTSHTRYIYIHGTNQVGELGTPASMGCIRMDPTVIAEWADTADAGTLRVWIGNL
jgi:hypothetical protein